MASTQKPACIVPSGDWCGESPVWHPEQQSVYWVDINRFLIHRYETAGGAVHSWFFDEPVTTIALTIDPETFVVALGSRLIFWEPRSDRRRDQGYRLSGWPAVRFNDGRPDPRGSFWLGTMRNNVNPDGSAGKAGGTDGVLIRVDPDGSVTEWKRGIGIANTMVWSPDRTRFYSTDTLKNEVYVYNYDASSGAISNERPFLTGFPRGVPDGSNIDREGYIWNCRHAGGCIVRAAPDGAIDGVIEVPSINVTDCTFGGADYRTLYITTASLGAPKGDRLAGSLYALTCEVPGLPENRFLVSGSSRR